MSMSKTAALKAARNAVGTPAGRGTSWQVHGPYYSTKDGLSGPSISYNAGSYAGAAYRRTCLVAELALRLMVEGTDTCPQAVDRAAYVIDDTHGNVAQRLNAALASL